MLDIIFASEKRKNTLLLLKEGPCEMDTLLKSLNTTRTALLPQIRILEDYYLIDQLGNSYELTEIGELVTNEMIPLLDIIEVFDNKVDYLGTHNLDFIPPHLVKKISKLRKCKEVNLPLPESYQLNQETVKTTFMSESFFVVTSFFHPNYPYIFPEMVQEDVKLHIIVSEYVLDIMRTQYHEIFVGLIRNGSLDLYAYPEEMGFQVIAFNDYRLLLRLLTNDGEIDINHMLCSSSDALEWGRELFEHYKYVSTPITEDIF
ncbi:helix-turn-helix transcriptional regulator [Methanolobus halotolerans]|uniref:helix-turn-helix transcriptional regulator n=1 Tax=Methanolobus halotolerans TaxID=2052935 RepID=UPI001F4750FB|nr:winged helix-turn-helix domain-containing protein [Methanolobus halotolerans]